MLLAVDEGHANIVEILLARADLEVNIQNQVIIQQYATHWSI
jgi:hypothetical protein